VTLLSVALDTARRAAGSRDAAAHTAVTVTVALVAAAARIVPVVRGGGLTGLGNYDDGVYYAAGTALLHGRFPYRDYLFLHPPGIVLLLAPFGLAGHDPTGLAAARLGSMLLGVANTVLVARILRPVGLFEAAVGGFFYATAFSAVYIEWTPLLEAPAQTCVLSAVLLLGRAERTASPTRVGALLAGALLGVSATFKIWGVVPVATVLVWLLVRRRWRIASQVVTGAVAAVTVICLPFFVAAPARMWRMVVVDQLGRGRSSSSPSVRWVGILTLGLHPRVASAAGFVAVTVIVVAALLAVAFTVRQARLCVVLVLSLTTLLLASPSWFLHYPGLATGPLAVALGAGTGVLVDRLAGWRTWVGWTGGVLVFVVLAVAAAPLTELRLGKAFPAGELATRATLAASTCVTSDDPTALVAMDLLSRNLDHGCRFVADLGGYSYQYAADRGAWIPRAHDQRWQHTYLAYLESGQAALPFRYGATGSLGPKVKAAIALWPVLARSGRYAVRAVR
jgi:alpha-1,2-mannosyltransferase